MPSITESVASSPALGSWTKARADCSPLDPGSDPFIIITSFAKPGPETRKFIRSHVMRGKNAGKFRNSKNWPSAPAEPQAADGRGVCTGSKARRTEQVGDQGMMEAVGWTLVTPRKIASELSLFGFGSDMQPYALGLIYRALTVVKPATYGLQDMTAEGPHDDNLFCFANLTHYPGILHSTLFAAQAFHDLATGRPYSTVAQVHLAKALRHLQRSLDDEKQALELSTMAVVCSLAMAAVIAGDLATAVKHMDGLQRIVQLRGGLRVLGPENMLAYKARVLDLGLAMGLGHKLRFPQHGKMSWSPQIAHGRPATRFPELAAALALYARPDPRLLHVWADLREFSRLVNEAAAATTRGAKISVEMAHRLATSVPYRLLRLEPRNKEGGLHLHPGVLLHELLRQCMLAYAKMLLIRLQGIGKKMAVLADGLRAVLDAWHDALQLPRAGGSASSDERGLRKLLLWGVFVASVSIFEDWSLNEQWLGGMMGQNLWVLELSTWAETRLVLKDFLWIDAVFDGPCQKVFERVISICEDGPDGS